MDMYGLEGSMGSGGGGGAKGSPGGRLPAMYVPSFYFVYTWTGGRGSAPIAGRPRIPNRHSPHKISILKNYGISSAHAHPCMAASSSEVSLETTSEWIVTHTGYSRSQYCHIAIKQVRTEKI